MYGLCLRHRLPYHRTLALLCRVSQPVKCASIQTTCPVASVTHQLCASTSYCCQDRMSPHGLRCVLLITGLWLTIILLGELWAYLLRPQSQDNHPEAANPQPASKTSSWKWAAAASIVLLWMLLSTSRVSVQPLLPASTALAHPTLAVIENPTSAADTAVAFTHGQALATTASDSQVYLALL